MQSVSRPTGQPAPVKIYNAVYSSVQVYECMIRGIAVMRRRSDAFVNATQILKVAGVDKGRRTKILEKEVLPGKHEIVQGGYGKYQGTWVPFERGQDLATQYGVAPLLAPLFEFLPSSNPNGGLTNPQPSIAANPRRLSASSSFSGLGPNSGYMPALPSNLAPPPIMPGSALRLLNQGRAQGLFTPSTSNAAPNLVNSRTTGYTSPTSHSQPPLPGNSPASSTQSLKRNRSEADVAMIALSPAQPGSQPLSRISTQSEPKDAGMVASGTSSALRRNSQLDEGPSPRKRPRKEASDTLLHTSHFSTSNPLLQNVLLPRPPEFQHGNNIPLSLESIFRPSSSHSVGKNGIPDLDVHVARFASRPLLPRSVDPAAPLKDTRKAAIVAAIYQTDNPANVIDRLREITSEYGSASVDIDVVLDDQGHTALHLAASMARQQTVDTLISNGADVHRGNYLGETPLIRACLSTQNSDYQNFQALVASLNASIRTLDTARRSVLHHLVSLAGVKGRGIHARYYMDYVLTWIAMNQSGDFKSLVDLQDEHGDTALNIAARVGSRSMVRTLLDVGANRTLANKLGLRPGDFGVETEELNAGPRAEDVFSSLRIGPPAPVQKSQDVIADMTTMIEGLSADFASEIKSKQDALDITQAHLRAATRELSEQRKQIQTWQAHCSELDQVNQRIRNLEKALADEDQFDWTGRTDKGGRDAKDVAGPAFQWLGQNSTLVGLGGSVVDVSFDVDVEPPLPTGDGEASLVRLRRLKTWHERTEGMMSERLKSLQGATAEKEYQCKKIVALCTGIGIDGVEDMLDNLVIAVESESQVVDIGRVSGFMQKVRDGVI